jgi:PIN domain nuclease of toxin-antitoxin system
MSVVLDAYAVIAALVGERARAEVEPLLSSGVVCAPNLTKVLDVCVRVHGNDEVTVRERIGWLLTGGLQVTALDTAMALAAGSLRAKHYRKRLCEVSQGDCHALALAQERRLPLATSDPHLARAARAEGVKIIGLPDSRGHRPAV